MKHKIVLGLFFSAIIFGYVIPVALATTTAVLLPQSDGTYKQFTPKSGTVHYTQVKESLCNGNTNYNTASSVSTRDSYGISVTSVGMGDGAIISQIDIVPCESRNEAGSGSVTSNVFYRWNGADSGNSTTNYSPTTTTPVGFATSTFSGLGLFKTSTSILEIGAVLSATTTPTRGLRLSRIATVITYSLTIPAAPSALAVNNVSNTENDLTWTDNSNNELRFNIYRSQDGGAYTQIATTTTWNIQSYKDTGVTSGHTYSYEVSAYNSAGEAFSSTVQSTITISSDITSSTTWQPFYVYLLTTLIPVDAGVTLTINPGTIVKFKTNGPHNASGLDVSGALIAQGASTSSIYFTSWYDDTVGGDTDGTTTPPGFGDWDKIKLETGASSTIITYANIRYGGSGNGGTPLMIWNNGDDLTISNTEVATGVNQTTAYGVYNPSGTTTITSCDIHGYRYGVEMEGGAVSMASSSSHDNQYGIYQSAGTLSVTSSDIYANGLGAMAGAGIHLSTTDFTIASNAIHGNKTYAVDGTGLGSVTFSNIWWGSWLAPGENDAGTSTSDKISSNATSTPWHRDLGQWSVRNFALTWYSSSQFSNELDAATFNWNSATETGGVLIPVSSTSSSSVANLIIYDYVLSDINLCGTTTLYPGFANTTDTIQLNPYCMIDGINANFAGLEGEVREHVLVHELGHALGLGHSDPPTNRGKNIDIMFSSNDAQTDLGPDDLSDYNFVWNTMRWAASRWWPRLTY